MKITRRQLRQIVLQEISGGGVIDVGGEPVDVYKYCDKQGEELFQNASNLKYMLKVRKESLAHLEKSHGGRPGTSTEEWEKKKKTDCFYLATKKFIKDAEQALLANKFPVAVANFYPWS